MSVLCCLHDLCSFMANEAPSSARHAEFLVVLHVSLSLSRFADPHQHHAISMVQHQMEFRSGEPPKSRIRVGFGFRVSGFVDWNQLSLSVSGFGFRRLQRFRASGFVDWNQLSLSVSGFVACNGFGLRVSGFVDWNPLSLSVSGFGFRSALGKLSLQSRFRVSGFGFRSVLVFRVGFGFRVSIGPGEVKSSESVSGFGFRVSIGPGEGKSSESVSGFGFRVSIGPGEGKSSESVSGFGFRSSKPTLTVGFGFRVSLVETNSADLSPDHVSSDVELFAPVPWCLLRGGLDLSIQVGPGSGLAVVSGADLGSETALCLRVSRLEISKRRDTWNNSCIAFRRLCKHCHILLLPRWC